MGQYTITRRQHLNRLIAEEFQTALDERIRGALEETNIIRLRDVRKRVLRDTAISDEQLIRAIKRIKLEAAIKT